MQCKTTIPNFVHCIYKYVLWLLLQVSQSEADCSVLSLVPRLSFPCAVQKEEKSLARRLLECSQFVLVFVSLHTSTGPPMQGYLRSQWKFVTK